MSLFVCLFVFVFVLLLQISGRRAVPSGFSGLTVALSVCFPPEREDASSLLLSHTSLQLFPSPLSFSHYHLFFLFCLRLSLAVLSLCCSFASFLFPSFHLLLFLEPPLTRFFTDEVSVFPSRSTGR